ncbi:MAG: AAA family ATPase [Pseudomonadota bacterium]|nr:AAA family ATPase [Pseudomonadota bacterium]
MPAANRFVLSGGPGGGKSALLAALAERGYPVVPESARAIIRSRMQAGLAPRPEPAAFAQAIFQQDAQRYQQSQNLDTPCFFDRSVVDALYMLHAAGAMDDAAVAQQCSAYPYNRTVFFLPPWLAIYQTDAERDQTFSEAQQVYANLKRWYLRWGYDVVDVPCCSVQERVAFVLHAVTQAAEQGGAD